MAQTGVLGSARRRTSLTPQASAAAVPMGPDSTRMLCAGTAGNTARIAGAMSALVTTSTRSAGISGSRRPTVSAMSGRPPTRASTGFGSVGVAIGQKRDPIPPANTTAQSGGVAVSSGARAACGSGNTPEALPEVVNLFGGSAIVRIKIRP